MVDNEEVRGQGTNIFDPRDKTFLCVRALLIHQREPGVNNLRHMSFEQYLNHVWQEGLPSGKIMIVGNYMNV